MNKKGNVGTVIFITLIIMAVAFVALFGALLNGVIGYTADQVLPEITGLGQVDNTNFTEIGEIVIEPTDTVIDSFNFLLGFAYAVSLIMIIGLSVTLRFTDSKWVISLFFILSFLVLLSSIFVSNTYEEFYSETDELGNSLKEQSLLSYMLLYSPLILTVVFFICGIIVFTGRDQVI